MCLKHMKCVIIDTEGSDEKILSRCTCAPSQCLVCNLLIESLNKAECLPKSDVSVAKVKAGTRALENIIRCLEDTFRVLEFQDNM